jgi:hypothetical protein
MRKLEVEMFAEYVKSLGLIIPATLVTIVLEAIAFARQTKAANASLPGTLFGFLIFGLGFGLLAIVVYHWVGNRYPETSAQVYFWLATGSAVALTLLALIMPLAFKIPWLHVAFWTVENFAWGLGYGWFLPQILGSMSKVG